MMGKSKQAKAERAGFELAVVLVETYAEGVRGSARTGRAQMAQAADEILLVLRKVLKEYETVDPELTPRRQTRRWTTQATEKKP